MVIHRGKQKIFENVAKKQQKPTEKACQNRGHALSFTGFSWMRMILIHWYFTMRYVLRAVVSIQQSVVFMQQPIGYLTGLLDYCLTFLWFFRYNPTIVSDDGYYIISLSYSIITIISLYYVYIIFS